MKKLKKQKNYKRYRLDKSIFSYKLKMGNRMSLYECFKIVREITKLKPEIIPYVSDICQC